MKFLNKKLFISVFILFIFLAPVTAWGQGAGLLTNGAYDVATNSGVDTTSRIPDFIGNLVNGIFAIVAVIFLAFTVLGGVMWIMAGGNEEKVTRAKKFIGGGIDGMIVIFLSYALVYFVLQALEQGAST